MIIEDIRREANQSRATIRWEGVQKDSFDAYFRHGGEGEGGWIGPSIAHPFLIAAILPAMRRGEKRIRVEGETVDPFLLDQLRSVVALAHAWWGDGTRYEPVEIEAEVAKNVDPPSQDRVAASFLTGGVDSLATLRNNRLNIPRSHPKSIEKNILVYGM